MRVDCVRASDAGFNDRESFAIENVSETFEWRNRQRSNGLAHVSVTSRLRRTAFKGNPASASVRSTTIPVTHSPRASVSVPKNKNPFLTFMVLGALVLANFGIYFIKNEQFSLNA